MSACALCTESLPPSELSRLSGVDLCTACRSRDPAPALAEHHQIAVQWDVGRLYFSAGLGISGRSAGFRIRCAPERLHHKVGKLLMQEVEVGDPAFDDRIWVRTDQPEQGAALLAHEGIQSALLGILSGLKVEDWFENHVTLDGATLTVGARPSGGMTPDKELELKLEVAALALHLRSLPG